MFNINLEEVDKDGAIREAAEEVSGDSRFDFLRKAGIAGGAALSGGAVLAAFAPTAMAANSAPPSSFGKGAIGVLNFALTLEYLESSFYNEATSKLKGLDAATAAFLKTTTVDENAHVAFLKKGLGSKAIKKPTFDFKGTTSDVAMFQATAYVLENTGVHAYLGQAPNLLSTPNYLVAAASIVTVEARHAGAIGSLLGKPIAANGAFDNGLPASAILKAVKGTGFIVG